VVGSDDRMKNPTDSVKFQGRVSFMLREARNQQLDFSVEKLAIRKCKRGFAERLKKRRLIRLASEILKHHPLSSCFRRSSSA
jgi:hypothetical protein